ncbi:MAG: hypothetical protein GY906_03845, partial [bacterium]|nr:hypothetical protein [bacterium]
MQLQSLISPACAAADTLIDVADILVNGVHAGLGEASGVAWVYVYADAVGASANADAAKGNALASTGTNSSSWQGFGAAS